MLAEYGIGAETLDDGHLNSKSAKKKSRQQTIRKRELNKP